jgi:hypothetical protein
MSPLYTAIIALFAWPGLLFLISRMSGWRELSENYPSPGMFDGRMFRFQSASLRLGTNYGGCLNVAVNHMGLHLSLVALFRIAHPPVFIPWPDISTKEKSGFLFRGMELRFARCPSVPFVISERLMKKISDARNMVEGTSTSVMH